MKAKKLLSFFLALLMVVSIIPATSITSSAAISGYSKLNYDETQMEIYFNPYGMEIPDTVHTLTIYNAYIDEPLNIDNGNICSISFINCTIDASDIGYFEQLYIVDILDSHLNDLTILSENTDITCLYVYGCHMESIYGVQYLSDLEVLNIAETGVESIELLKYNENLVQLNLDYTCVTDLSPLVNLDLQTLSIINSMSVLDLTPVMSLDSLEYFYSSNCEMAYTTEFCDFIESNHIVNDMDSSWVEIQEEVKNAADNIYEPYMSDEEIIEATVEYVTDLMEYDDRVNYDENLSLEDNDRALYYAVKGEGLCRNYSALTMALLQQAEIPVYEITSVDHVWNIVEVDNEYYWLDTTWVDYPWSDFTDSLYYMNNNYCFHDHYDTLSVPFSMYNAELGVGYIFEIYKPSTDTIRCKDGIVIHTPFEHEQFEGTTISWETDNDNFDVIENDDGSVTVISRNNGETYIVANLIDENGDVIAIAEIVLQSKAGFFDKLAAFFRTIFGLTRIYEY